MSHKDLKAFGIQVPVGNPEKMEEFQELMDKINDKIVIYVQNLAKELNIPESLAAGLYYLRSRSRWSQEKENKIIDLHRKTGVTEFRILSGEEDEVIKQLERATMPNRRKSQ
jgi:hypothetical protein